MSCPPRLLVRRGSPLPQVLPFDTNCACLTYMGRNAIWQAMRILGLNPGDEILVPAYNCGSEIDPLLHYGLTIVPYRVSRFAQVDAEDIRCRITTRTRAVYVTHYFGFPQRLEQIMRLCRERQLFLIEDCALALFSRDGGGFVGRMGDVAVFSFRKTLPVPDGGAVIVNTPNLQAEQLWEQPPLSRTLSDLVPLAGRWARRQLDTEWDGIEKMYRFLRSRLNRRGQRKRPCRAQDKFVQVCGDKKPALGYKDQYDTKISRWTISPIAKRIISNVNSIEIVAKRRANFQALLKALQDVPGAEPLFKELPEGVCPNVFPLLTEKRSELQSALCEKKVSAIEWWAGYHPAICWDHFPEAAYLKDYVLALPIHSGLSQDDMAYVAAWVQDLVQKIMTDEGQSQNARPLVAGSLLF